MSTPEKRRKDASWILVGMLIMAAILATGREGFRSIAPGVPYEWIAGGWVTIFLLGLLWSIVRATRQ
jgi:hypothetical protein